MVITRPFAYTPTGNPIGGCDVFGKIVAGTPTLGFDSTGLSWWGGPDEWQTYYIGYSDASIQRTGRNGATANTWFKKASSYTDSGFLSLANTIGATSFANVTAAKTWLNTNGYWTNYVPWVNGATSIIPGATTIGGITNSSQSPFASGTSFSFNGTSGYFQYPADNDFLLTGDFTVEWFQYMTSQPSNPRVFQLGNYNTQSFGVSIEGSSTSAIFYLWIPNANNITTFSSGSHLNTWIHFAVVRTGTSVKVYRNGTQIGTTITYANPVGTSSVKLSVGQETNATSNSYFPGYITQFRWTKDLAVYTGNFTTPTGPLGVTSGPNPFGGVNTAAIPSGYVKLIIQ